jgi:hypothetical protein
MTSFPDRESVPSIAGHAKQKNEQVCVLEYVYTRIMITCMHIHA